MTEDLSALPFTNEFPEDLYPKPTPKKTKLEQFIEELSKYPDKETAKLHIAEIANKIGCTKALGYKALNKVEKFQPKGFEPKEPTVKIPETKPEPIEEDEFPEDLEDELREDVTILPPTETSTATQAPPIPQIGVGFNSKDVTWMFKKGFETIADITGYGAFALTKDEAERLGEIWTPIINTNLPQFIPHAPIITAALSTLIIVAPRVKGYWDYRKKNKEKPIEVKPQETPKNERESEREQPQPQPSETKAPELPRPDDVGFYKKLLEMT